MNLVLDFGLALDLDLDLDREYCSHGRFFENSRTMNPYIKMCIKLTQTKEAIMKRLMKGLVGAAFFSGMLAWSGPGASPQKTADKAAPSKYGKYIISKEILKVVPEGYTGISLFAHEGELKTDVSMGYHCVTKPILFSKTHTHNNAEILCFIGGNPADIQDFGAEVEVELGSEHEKHVITQTSCISMPANLPHCPLNIKKVTKPIVFLEISLAPAYKAVDTGKN